MNRPSLPRRSDPLPVTRFLYATLAVGLAVFAGFSGCSLPRGGTLAQDCTANVQCDDLNPCTTDTCAEDGVCVLVVDETLAPSQIGADCKRLECQAGEPVEVADDSDVADDQEPCTTDACAGDVTTHTPLDDGAACAVGANAGTCGAGKCEIECTAADAVEKCDDKNGCTTDSCNVGAGSCEHAPLDNVAPAESQSAGDCKTVLCQVGVESPVADNADLPDDQNPCTADVCTEGVPTNPLEDAGSTCSDGGILLATVCDDAGACVECNLPADCKHLPSDDDCQQRSCIANTCGQTFTVVDKPIGAQAAGDCKIVVCDGSGKTKINDENSDVPLDNNQCTADVCTNGMATNPFVMKDTKCGLNDTLFCNATGVCVGCT
ncbi:MAG: hypothetical protein EXR75_06955, partial [Myxococcales bacterium]|nr:hypothetical protein [Myxococcales bacterium]